MSNCHIITIKEQEQKNPCLKSKIFRLSTNLSILKNSLSYRFSNFTIALGILWLEPNFTYYSEDTDSLMPTKSISVFNCVYKPIAEYLYYTQKMKLKYLSHYHENLQIQIIELIYPPVS